MGNHRGVRRTWTRGRDDLAGGAAGPQPGRTTRPTMPGDRDVGGGVGRSPELGRTTFVTSSARLDAGGTSWAARLGATGFQPGQHPRALTVLGLSSVALLGGRADWPAALVAVPVVSLLTLLALVDLSAGRLRVLSCRGRGNRSDHRRASRPYSGRLDDLGRPRLRAGHGVLERRRNRDPAFPSSWGVLAVEAAGAGNAALSVAWLVALVVLDVVMLGTWVFIVDAPSGRTHPILGPRRRLPRYPTEHFRGHAHRPRPSSVGSFRPGHADPRVSRRWQPLRYSPSLRPRSHSSPSQRCSCHGWVSSPS